MKYKWCPAVCKCGATLPPVRTPADTPEPWVSIYPCPECEYPEEAKAERAKWAEADQKIMELAARGELLDADKNPVPAIVVVQ